MLRQHLLIVPVLAATLIAVGCSSNDSGGTTTTMGCQNNEALFREKAWNSVLGAKCIACHTSTGLAKDTHLVLVNESDPQWLTKNQAAFRTAAALEYKGQPLLWLKPTGQYPDGHGGGQVISPSSEDAGNFRFMIEWMRGEVPGCVSPDSGPVISSDGIGPRMLRRLTHVEYQNTVRDLVGVDMSGSTTFAADVVVNGFSNNAGALKVSGLLADQYRTAAESIAEEAIGSKYDSLLSCHSTQQTSCASTFIRDFGKRAFRRPLTGDEMARYASVFEAVSAEDGFDEGIKWVLSAMLQSPHFLYRSELGVRDSSGDFKLTAYELASQLSYLFTQTMPDATLMAAADSGALLQEDELKAQAARLAEDPRAAAALMDFFGGWLHLDRLMNVPRDASIFPELTREIRLAMAGEVARFVADLAMNKATLSDALLSKYSYMTDQLAAFYGLPPGTGPADSEGFRKVNLEGTEYGGLLTMGGLLTVHALPNDTSPIHRGKLVRERLLCQELPPPPAGLNASPPAMDPTKSTRERYAAHASRQDCATCHHLMDPIGFGFESFDGIGRYRATEQSRLIDTSGEILDSVSTNGKFTGVRGLSELLATSRDVKSCYTRMWTAYGFGVSDASSLTSLIDGQLTSSSDIAAVRMAITGTPHFRTRHGEPGELDAPGAGSNPQDPPPITGTPTDPGTGTPSTGVSLTMTESSRWGTGVCMAGHVTNNTGTAVSWQVEHALEGTVTNIWNALVTQGTPATFSGDANNATLQPSASTDFGYCVSF